MIDPDDPLWIVRPLLEAGFDPKHLRSLGEWVMFEVIAAEEEQRPPDFNEIRSHMDPKTRVAFNEMLIRFKERGAQ